MIETFPVMPKYTKHILLCDECGEEMIPSERQMSHIAFKHECKCGHVDWYSERYPLITTEWIGMPSPGDYRK